MERMHCPAALSAGPSQLVMQGICSLRLQTTCASFTPRNCSQGQGGWVERALAGEKKYNYWSSEAKAGPTNQEQHTSCLNEEQGDTSLQASVSTSTTMIRPEIWSMTKKAARLAAWHQTSSPAATDFAAIGPLLHHLSSQNHFLRTHYSTTNG